MIAFCSLGALSQTQQIAHTVIDAMPGADREKAFAETLCMVSTVSARAAASALPPGDASREHVSDTLSALPLTLHSYVAGIEVLSEEDGPPDTRTDHLERMSTFYSTQLGDVGYPDRKALRHVMILWMGRISPSGLDEHPEKRLDRLGLVDRLTTYVRLIEAFTRNAGQEA